jgi:hypothetical protein
MIADGSNFCEITSSHAGCNCMNHSIIVIIAIDIIITNIVIITIIIVALDVVL